MTGAERAAYAVGQRRAVIDVLAQLRAELSRRLAEHDHVGWLEQPVPPLRATPVGKSEPPS